MILKVGPCIINLKVSLILMLTILSTHWQNTTMAV